MGSLKGSLKWVLLVTIFVVASVSTSRAQPLADRVPDDAILYVGWQGASEVRGFEGSNLQGVLSKTTLQQEFGAFLDRVVARIAEEDPDAAEPLAPLRALLADAWRYPTAFVVRPPVAPDQPPRIALLVAAGNPDAEDVRESMDEAIATVRGPARNAMRSFTVDGIACLAIAHAEDDMAIAGDAAERPKPLSVAPDFIKAIAEVGPDGVYVIYGEVETLLTAINAAADPQVQETVGKTIRASGVAGARRYVSAGRFDGKEWETRSFLDAPSPRTGVFEAFDAEPLSADILSAIPPDAVYARAGKFDALKFLAAVQSTAAAADKQAGDGVVRGIGFLTMALGRNLRTDILEPLGSEWATYLSPSVAGTGIYGLVLVNKCDDATKVSDSLLTASESIGNLLASAMQNESVRVQGRTVTIAGVEVHQLRTPFVAPAWAVKDGMLYLGLYPQTVAAAANAGGSSKQGIAEAPGFKAMIARLEGANANTVSYTDLGTATGNGYGYQYLMMIGNTLTGLADLYGIDSPDVAVPTLAQIAPFLSPAGEVRWADDAGFHSRSIAPFPGATLVTEQGWLANVGAAYAAVVPAALLPAMSQASETANRVRCASNMRQIGQGILLHANENKNAYPPDQGSLLRQGLTPVVFLCPGNEVGVPPEVAAMNLEEQAAWVNENSDFVYLPSGLILADIDAGQVVLYERPGAHNAEGMNLLYADGHVAFLPIEEVADVLSAQQGIELDELLP